MKISRPAKKTKTTTFSSLQELVSYIRTAPVNPVFNERSKLASSMEETGERKFYETRNMDEALDLLSKGWSDKSKELESMLHTELKKRNTQVSKQKSVYDVVGGNASVPRYLQGVPTNMIRQVRTPVKIPVKTINYNISFNYRVTPQEMVEKAIECLSYVNQIESQGTRVNVNVFLVSESLSRDHTLLGYEVPVKKSNERFSLAKMTFVLCHASMLRRVMVACLERDPDATSGFVWGSGRPIRDTSTLAKVFPDTEFFNCD